MPDIFPVLVALLAALAAMVLFKVKKDKPPVEPDWPAIYKRYPDIKNSQSTVGDCARYCLRNISDPSSLEKGQHFYIAFDPNDAGVQIPEHVRKKYFPAKPAVIVLQHAFKVILIEDSRLNLELFFDAKPEKITIPFNSILVFGDPSIGFVFAKKDTQ